MIGQNNRRGDVFLGKQQGGWNGTTLKIALMVDVCVHDGAFGYFVAHVDKNIGDDLHGKSFHFQ